MGLNNIQSKKNTVLNRPMFARMKDGTIKPVQYAAVGLLVPAAQVGSRLLPYAGRGLQAIKNTLPAIINKGRSLITRGGPKVTGGGTGTAVVPYTGGGAGLPAVSSVAKSKLPLLRMFGLASAPLALDQLTEFAEKEEVKEEVPTKKRKFGSGIEEEGGPKGKYDHQKKEVFKEEITKDIKSGNLDEMISERMELFNRHLGDSKDKLKAGGYAALTEFGLNLASARGGNLMDKIARSAKDPLKTFTDIGATAAERADKIKMAAIESGVSAMESEKDRQGRMDIAQLQNMPDFVKTLEYFETIPELAKLPVETKARLAKTKAVQSDQEFIKEISIELIKAGEDAGDVASIAQGILTSITGESGGQQYTKGQKAKNEAGEIIIFDGEKWVNEKDYQG